MNRREFIRNSAVIASTLAIAPPTFAAGAHFPVVRTPESKRRFKSVAVERVIERVQLSIGSRNWRGCLAIAFRTRSIQQWILKS
jgi:hypothetical protein